MRYLVLDKSLPVHMKHSMDAAMRPFQCIRYQTRNGGHALIKNNFLIVFKLHSLATGNALARFVAATSLYQLRRTCHLTTIQANALCAAGYLQSAPRPA